MFTKLCSKFIISHLIIQCIKFHPAFCDSENKIILDLDSLQDVSENTEIHKSSEFDENWKKVPWGYSASELIILQSHESVIHNMMVKYEKILEKRLEYVRQYLQDYKESVPKDDGPFWNAPKDIFEAAKIVANHPILSYRLIRRFAKNLNWIERSLEYDEGLIERFKEIRGKIDWPVQWDLNRAIDSILKMQYTYDFQTLPFSSGILEGIDLKSELSKLHMFEIGRTAINVGQFALSLEWLNVASKKTENAIAVQLVNETELEIFIKEAKQQHDDEFDAAELTDLTLFERKVTGFKKLPRKRRSLYGYQGFNPLGLDEYNVHHRYNILCMGVMMKDTFQASSLHCWLDDYSHPYFILQPLRSELHSFDPYVIQIHDLVRPKQRSDLIETAKIHQEILSTHPDAENNYPVAYLDEEMENFHKFRYLETLAELITDLDVEGRENSEPLEVSEHTFGARYSITLPAFKHAEIEDEDLEDTTVANFLVQLTSSVLGGRLVFPKINIIVDSSPGSAVFWYNTFKNGQPDDRIVHAHCPTVFHSKWVALKRIKLKGNMLKRPCSRIPEK